MFSWITGSPDYPTVSPTVAITMTQLLDYACDRLRRFHESLYGPSFRDSWRWSGGKWSKARERPTVRPDQSRDPIPYVGPDHLSVGAPTDEVKTMSRIALDLRSAEHNQ